MDRGYFLAGSISSLVVFLLLIVVAGKASDSVEMDIVESCNVAGSFVVDGRAYKCEALNEG